MLNAEYKKNINKLVPKINILSRFSAKSGEKYNSRFRLPLATIFVYKIYHMVKTPIRMIAISPMLNLGFFKKLEKTDFSLHSLIL